MCETIDSTVVRTGLRKLRRSCKSGIAILSAALSKLGLHLLKRAHRDVGRNMPARNPICYSLVCQASPRQYENTQLPNM